MFYWLQEFCGLISAKQPLLLENIPTGRQEFVEIIDSSDDEDTSSDKTKSLEPTKSAFSKNDLSVIESELHATIESVLNRVEIQNQLTWSKTILMERLKRLEMETDYVDGELKALQRKADKMHEGLYSCPKIKIRQLQPLDLNSGKLMSFEPTVQKEVQVYIFHTIIFIISITELTYVLFLAYSTSGWNRKTTHPTKLSLFCR